MSDEQQKQRMRELKKRNHAQAGFGLVQMASVIVIIGLVAGGIMMGRELVQQSAIRKQMTQLNDIQSGVQNFRNKYNCLPGDCADPTVISGYTYSGNGDGYLEQAWNSNENKGFWIHLTRSNMIKDLLVAHPDTSNMSAMRLPLMAANQGGHVTAYGNRLYSASVLQLASNSASAGALNMLDARNIDVKMDDGLAISGKVRTAGFRNGSNTIFTNTYATMPPDTTPFTGSSACISGGVYSTSATYNSCNLTYSLN